MTIELSDKLTELESLAGQAGPIISVYLDLAPGPQESRSVSARLKNLLDPIAEEGEKLDHAPRIARRKAVSRILELEPRFVASLGKCVAVFVSEGGHQLEEVLTLPRKCWDVAVADSRPYLRPLLAALDAFHTIATVIVDPQRSEIFVSQMGEVRAHEVESSEPIRKSDYGGFQGVDEHNTRNRSQEMHAKHFKAVSERLTRLHETHHLELIFVGGREETVAAFIRQLHDIVRGLVADTFTIDIHTATAASVHAVSNELEEKYEQMSERELVSSTLDLARAGGPAVVGLADTLAAANFEAIEVLLVAGNEMIPGWVCGTCGGLGSSGPACTFCGEPAHEVLDLVEWLVFRARHQKATVEHVMVATELDDHRVAARVRFHAPPIEPG
jgi:peptide subunit release factor 1 (eRF1)